MTDAEVVRNVAAEPHAVAGRILAGDDAADRSFVHGLGALPMDSRSWRVDNVCRSSLETRTKLRCSRREQGGRVIPLWIPTWMRRPLMTDAKPDLFERAQETSPLRRRGMWLWLLVVVVMAAGVLAAVLWWPDDDETPVLSENPPYGLAGIELPKTEAEVIAVFEAMPAIDGRQPVLSQMGDDEFYPTATYYESEEGGFGVEIQAFPDDDPLESIAPDVLAAEGWNLEAHAVDPDSDLLWMATGPAPEDEFDVFTLWWADPDGSWRFFAVADTAEFRVKLVNAFMTAARG
jgi:hypothetical protein